MTLTRISRLSMMCFVALLSLAPAAPGEDDRWGRHDHGGPFALSLLWENDSPGYNPFNPSDRHYTNGVEAVLAGQPDLAAKLAQAIPGLGTDFTHGNAAAGLLGGQFLFTPQNRTLETIDPRDRPYAGYLFAGAFLQRSTGEVFDHLELDLGLVGPSALGQNAQDMIHGFLGDPKFQGWDHQLKDEPEFNLALQRRWRRDLTGEDAVVGADLIPHAGLRLGTVYRDIAGGATLRLGWQLPDDAGPGNIHHPLDYTPRNRPRPTVYAFLRGEVRAVEHNLFLDGNQFHDSLGVTPQPVVGEATAGVVVQLFCPCLQFIHSETFATHEFKGQRKFDSYGTWLLTVHFDF